jgi:nicotinate-nucleotide pyrophosphorylase (carboxylating)
MVINQKDINANVTSALIEDVGSGDITAELIPEGLLASAILVTREHAVVAGTQWFEEVFNQLPGNTTIDWNVADGDLIAPEQRLCRINGSARSLLTGERTALNFLQTISATATTVASFVDIVKDTKTKILDTRKTIPGLRLAQKYAVACGGGTNHRIGLYDAILIKENHIMAAGSIMQAVVQAREKKLPVEVEVESLAEFKEALEAEADQILLDNFDLPLLEKAVKINQGRAKLEASGNVNKEDLHDIARTGVDYISIGALTKNIRAIDFSMRM